MNAHLTDSECHDYIDGTTGSADCECLGAHLASCDACRQRVERVQRLVKRLAASSIGVEPPTWVRADVRRALESHAPADNRKSPGRKHLVWAMAAMLLAVFSFLAGRMSSDGRARVVVAADPSSDAMLAVQAAGTDFVAALAAVASRRDSLGPPLIAQAREAALATLYAAAAEFNQLLPDDSDAQAILRAADVTRRRAIARGLSATVPF